MTARLTFKWNPKDERALLKASERKGGIKAFASSRGISYLAAHRRLYVIRKRAREE